jgi:hypothetical protein
MLKQSIFRFVITLILILCILAIFEPVKTANGADAPITIDAIPGVTVPVTGATPVTAITPTDQYTGTVTWMPNDNPFKGAQVYTATITLTPKAGFTLTGVTADFFTVAGATSVHNLANSGVVTADFPATGADEIINIAAIPGVTAPVTGATPVTAITPTDQYTGTVTWNPADNPFKGAQVYTATITLTAKAGFTLTGVTANFFTVAGATSTNLANSGVVTAVFPATGTSPPPPPPGGGGGGVAGVKTILTQYMNSEGQLLTDVAAVSLDGQVMLYLPEGTTIKDKYGKPLRAITIKENPAPPEPPAKSQFVCLAYDITPSDATFDPPAQLNYYYSDSDVPAGVAEENMVFVILKDGVWVKLEGAVIDAVNNVVTIPLSHLSIYSVVAYTYPASFEVTNMTVRPLVVNPLEVVTISATITNTGDITGNFEVSFKLDNEVNQVQTISLNGHASRTLSFSAQSGTAGEHIVGINDLSAKFTVKQPEGTVAEVPIPEPTPGPTPEPTGEPAPTITPTTTPTTTPTQAIEPPATTKPSPTPPGTLPIQLTDNRMRIITGVVGGCLVLMALIILLIRRRGY